MKVDVTNSNLMEDHSNAGGKFLQTVEDLAGQVLGGNKTTPSTPSNPTPPPPPTPKTFLGMPKAIGVTVAVVVGLGVVVGGFFGIKAMMKK